MARIEIPRNRMFDIDFDHVKSLCFGTDSTGLHLTVAIGADNDFIRDSTTLTLDGDDNAVRPVVTYLMDRLKA